MAGDNPERKFDINQPTDGAENVTNIGYVAGDIIQGGQSPKIEDALSYLNWLHRTSRQSGLLRAMDPRTADPTNPDGAVTIDQVYTPLDTRDTIWRKEDGSFLKPHEVESFRQSGELESISETPLSAMETANHHSRLVMLGDPGSGKSTFVSFLALCLTGHFLDKDAGWLNRLTEQSWACGVRLPVLVTLRDFAQDIPKEPEDTSTLLMDHVARQVKRFEGAEAVIREWRRAGEAFFLLDGLDEVPQERRDIVRAAVTDFIDGGHPDNRYLVTCRILSYANSDWQIPGMESRTLAPFDQEKIAHFVATWYNALRATGSIDAAITQRRIDDLQGAIQHEQLADMPQNPMLLSVMALVHSHTGALPRESARLYEECVKLLMFRWKAQDADDLLQQLDAREDDIYRLLWEIAYEAHDKQADREGAADLTEYEILNVARKRFDKDWNKAQAFCDYVEERAGLLIGRGHNEAGERVFTFPHRTFQEYLAGCHIANSSRSFRRIMLDKARAGAGWREALLLATGHSIFIQRDIEKPIDAVERMVDKTPQSDDDWRAVWLAGDMLLLVGLRNVEADEIGQEVLPKARNRLADLVGGGQLDPVERAGAGRTLSLLGDPRKGVGLDENDLPIIDWVEVPAGEFIYQDGERLHLDTFYISRYPITYAQFQAFLDDPEGFERDEWWAGLTPEYQKQEMQEQAFQYANHPRERVSWYQAVAFCRWLSAKQGCEIRLPTEQEWEKAARGTEGCVFPWGDEFDPEKCNTRESEIGRTTAVGMYPVGVSPCGALDMSGNVLEWCLNKYRNPENVDLEGDAGRVWRGGSWLSDGSWARSAFRFRHDPDDRYNSLGFRVVVARPPSL